MNQLLGPASGIIIWNLMDSMLSKLKKKKKYKTEDDYFEFVNAPVESLICKWWFD